ncbi:MAG: InlB B-repeat-containing protein [Clostridiales bacterium]|nr:InlB B-repeat-containing protein [Clostridiales bacterium]
MKRFTKLLVGLFLVAAMCSFLSIPVSATETVPNVPTSAAVNGGLEAEILTDAEQNNTVPVKVKITNTNAYEVTDVGYQLTATDNGKLSGRMSDSNLSIAPNGSITTDALILSAVPGEPSPDTGAHANPAFWFILFAASLVTALLLIVKKKKIRQSLSMILTLVLIVGTFATVGASLPAAAADAETTRIPFVVTKDVFVNGETVRLTLTVTLPDSAGGSNHTVSFLDAEQKTVKAFAVPDGGTVPVDEIPILTKSGKSFDGWFLTADTTQPFYSDDPVKKDLTVYPIYSELDTDAYYMPVCHDAGFVEPTHRIVIVSEREITAANLADFACLETLFGETPEIAVTALGNNQYELSAVYTSKGTYWWKLVDETVSFYGLDTGVREYSFTILGEETETYKLSDELRDISACDLISLEETSDEAQSILHVYGSSYAVGARLGVPSLDGGKIYYKVTEVLQHTTNQENGRTSWSLQVTPCAIEEVYDEIDVNQQNREADEIIDISNPEDIQNYIHDIENSEQMRIYADYIASAVNDSETFQQAVLASYGKPAYIDYQSNTMLLAQSNDLSAQNAEKAMDEALALVGGIDVAKPGVNISISASAPVVKTNDFNSYWDERYAEVGEIDPKTGQRVNQGKKDFFGNNFASIETNVSITFSLNGGTKNIAVEAKLLLKQYVKICSATQVKLEVGWNIYTGSEINAGATAYTDTSVDFTVTLKTDNGGFDISEELDDIISAANGEEYKSDNKYIRRFRNLYDGTERDFVEVYRKDFCKFRFTIGPVEINIPVAFVVRFGLSAGVGIGYDYATTYTIGVYKDKNSDKIVPYHKPGEPGWEFDFYVAGHAGVKAGLNAQLGITITSCSKLFEIGLEAELGIRADFYGYYLLKMEKDWKQSGLIEADSGAYYFCTKIYFDLKLFAKAFTFENKWNLYSYDEVIYTAGNRYVLMDFNRRHETQTEPIVIPVTKDSKLTKVKDGSFTYDTVCFNLKTYFDSLKPTFFDLQKSNEVFNKSEAKELINKYTTVTVGGSLTLPNGAVKATGNTTVHLRPAVLNALLNEEYNEINTSITFVYNGPMFTFGDDRPSVTYKIKLVSQKYLTGKKYNVQFMVDGKLYQTKQYLEGTSISPWDAYVSNEFCDSIGISHAEFDIPVEKVTQDMVLHANCRYEPNNTVNFEEKTLTQAGFVTGYTKYLEISKGYEVDHVKPRAGVMAAYFLGWDLEGDNSDELNVPVPGQNTTYTYQAVYSELPEYTVTIVDRTAGRTISQKTVKLGEAVTIEEAAPPDDGRRYTSRITCESGSYISTSYAQSYLNAASIIYPTSDITLAWHHQVNTWTAFFYTYTGSEGNLYTTQKITDGGFITDPIGKENWSQLDEYEGNDLYREFIGWEIWDGTAFVDATTVPITENCGIHANYRYARKHNITLLAEDGETVLFSGFIYHDIPLSTKYYTTRLPDQENTYEMYWKSTDDGTVAEKAEKSGSYQLCWAEKAREYNIELDAEAAVLAGDAITFESGIAYEELYDHIAERIGSFVPQKQETVYETYQYDGFSLRYDANANGQYGICTVSFKFIAVPKTCTITLDVRDSLGNTGSLWLGQESVALQNGTYLFDFTLSEANTGCVIYHTVVPLDSYYNFVGWSFNGKIYTVEDTLSLIGLDNVTLTAVYERKPFAVTFQADGGVFEGNQTVYANENEQIQLPTPVKSPDAQYTYRFIGWSDGSGHNYTDSYPVSGTVSLTAVYEKTLRSYYITFHADGGKFSGEQDSVSLLTDYGTVPVPETPEKQDTATERYTFDGWTPTIVAVTGAAEYTAKWKTTKLYTLTFDAGDGQFDALGTAQKEYVLTEGTEFSIATVPAPYFNHNGEVRRFTGWSVTETVISVTQNAEITALWSEPVSAIGILVSDGTHTEDVASYLAGAQNVSGYSLEYNAGEIGVEPFFKLMITENNLTLSGNGAVDYTEVYNVSTTLNDLTMTSSVTVFGNCEFTIDGTVTLNSANGATVMLAQIPDSPEGTPKGSLAFVGADKDARLIVNSSDPAGAVRSFDGDITITGLTADITANEVIDYPTPIALGSNDVSFYVRMNDSTVRIHKGYLSGMVSIEDSRIEFDNNDYTGIFSPNFNYEENPVQPDSIISLENSVILFHGKAYIDLSYSQPLSNPNVYFWFFKKDGEDQYGEPIVGWFNTKQELETALNTSEGAWMLHIGEGSSIEISE